MIECEKVIYNSVGSRICVMCYNHYEGGRYGMCFECNLFEGKFVLVFGNFRVFNVGDSKYRVYFNEEMSKVWKYLREIENKKIEK